MITSNYFKKINSISEKNLATFERIAFGFLMAILVVIYVLKLYTAISYPYIQEYREPTMVVYASEFAKGHNPYALSALDGLVPTIISVYGFLPALICAPFVAFLGLFGVSALIVCRVFTIVAEIIALFFIYKTIFTLTDNKVSALFGALISTGLCWRYNPFGGAFTDMWGFCMLSILTYLVINDKKKKQYNPIAYALILVISFYIKQYYIFPVLGLVIYLFIHSKKDLVKLIVSGIVMTLISLAIVQMIFPLFLSESLVISQAEPFVSGEYFGLPWSINQIPYIIKHYYLIPTLVFIVAFIYLLVKKSIKKQYFSSYVFVQIAASFPLVLHIARNHGTYLTYWFQLWVIYFVIAFAVIIDTAVKTILSQNSDSKDDAKSLNRIASSALFLLTGLLFAYQSRSLIIQKPHDSEIVSLFEKTYNYLDEYGADGKILGDSCVALYLYDHNIETSEYGQAEYNGSWCLENINKSNIYSMFPYAIKLCENNIAYEEKVKASLANKEYSVVELGNMYRYFITDEEMEKYGYERIDRYDMYIAGINIDTSIWIPKKD